MTEFLCPAVGRYAEELAAEPEIVVTTIVAVSAGRGIAQLRDPTSRFNVIVYHLPRW